MLKLSLLIFASLTPLLAGWSFQPIRRPALPDPSAHPIDAFVRARLAKENLKPAPPAAPETLLRRLSLDITGLPPTPEHAARYLANPDETAYRAAAKALLASPQFGEKWARVWLDQARYADSDGFRSDKYRPYAYRFRDWVIDALNRDMPFDRFTIEQIAGDLLPQATLQQRIATGFHRNTLTNREGGIDPEQFRVEQVLDRTNTVGTVWLGLTVGCAQCHDHKFDPISQADYYRLFAFFNTAEERNVAAPLPGEPGPYLAKREPYRAQRTAMLKQAGIPALQLSWEAKLLEAASQPGKWLDWDHAFDDLRTACEDGEKILRTSPARRTERQNKILTDYFVANYHRVISKARAKQLGLEALSKRLAALDRSIPPFAEAPILAEERPDRVTHILARGDYRSPSTAVQPATPAALPAPASKPRNRLDLALWLVDPRNPLVARVTVNRIWQEYFGHGLVRTPDNFGSQGEAPTHPELLDWLAAEFIESGWQVKRIHEWIVTSETYRQSSRVRPELLERDPENRWLARQNRFRLPAEAIRDSALAAAGKLSPMVGGPSFAGSGDRRSLYMQRLRTAPQAFLANFDAPAGYSAACKRHRSNSPLQALNLLNDPVFQEAAQVLAARATQMSGTSWDARLKAGFQLALQRPPAPEEAASIRKWAEGRDPERAFVAICGVLLNTDEFQSRE